MRLQVVSVLAQRGGQRVQAGLAMQAVGQQLAQIGQPRRGVAVLAFQLVERGVGQLGALAQPTEQVAVFLGVMGLIDKLVE
jgi:hypothetical protein